MRTELSETLWVQAAAVWLDCGERTIWGWKKEGSPPISRWSEFTKWLLARPRVPPTLRQRAKTMRVLIHPDLLPEREYDRLKRAFDMTPREVAVWALSGMLTDVQMVEEELDSVESGLLLVPAHRRNPG